MTESQKLIDNKRSFTLVKNGYSWTFDKVEDSYLYKAFVFRKGINANIPYVKEVLTIDQIKNHLDHPVFIGADIKYIH